MTKTWYYTTKNIRSWLTTIVTYSTFNKSFLLGILAGISFTLTYGFFVFFVGVGQVEATNKHKEERIERCDPTPTRIPTPTVVPTLIPTPSPASPSATASSNPQPVNSGSDQHVPTCRDGAVLTLPNNLHVIRNKDTAEVKWFPTAGNQVNLFYKENISKGWTHSVPDELNDGYIEVKDLNPRESYTFGLMQKNNCGSGEMVMGIVIDPPASKPTLFKMNYWIWK